MHDDFDGGSFTHSTLESGKDFYITDRGKRKYHFKIASFPVPSGIMSEAVEVKNDDLSGYRFAILSEWEVDIEHAEKRLKQIIKKKINLKHLTHRHGRWGIEPYRTAKGRVEYNDDPSRSEFDRLFVIDGHEITIEDFVQMLECYEGWGFHFKIVDPLDENNTLSRADC